ncbi:hypothetical protein QBC44DRAFT_1029 [Cladorrhinum sp. PSN332]|nr:hypothetical protein QBC44DRAFT_1029 [Cladorrhinum sp. PSN332]
MPRAPKSSGSSGDGRTPYRRPASEGDRLPVHPRKNKVPAEQRKRVQMACHECNVRRIKCSGSEACTQCIANNRDCQFPKADAKRTVSSITHEYYTFRHNKLSYLAGTGPPPAVPTNPIGDVADPELRFLEMDDWEGLYESFSNLSVDNNAANESSSKKRRDQGGVDLGVVDARLLIDSAGTTRLFGRSSGAYFLDGVKEVMSVAGPLANVIAPDKTHERAYSDKFLKSLGHYQTYDSRRLQLSHPAPVDSMPPREEVKSSFELVRNFLADGNGDYMTGGSMFFPIPRASLVAGLGEAGRDKEDRELPTVHYKPRVALAHAVLAFARLLEATGSGSRVEGLGKMGEGHYSTAKSLVGGPLDGNAYTKEDIPTLTMMALYLVENNRRDQASAVIGLAMQTAVAHGMHKGWCSDEQDVRVFWTLYVIDRWLACMLGRPVRIQDHDIQTPFPRTDEKLSSPHGLLAHIHLSRIQQMIIYDNYLACNQQLQVPGQDSATTRVKQDLQNLEGWAHTLPESLILPADPLDKITLSVSHILGADKKEFERQQKAALELYTNDRACLSLHMSHNQLVIIAVRPAYLAAVQKAIASIAESDKMYDLEQDPQAPAILFCTRAAQRNLRLGWLVQQKSPGNRLLISDLHHIFNAALILIMHQIVASNFRLAYSSEVDWAYELFVREASMGSPFAEDCMGVLGGFRQLAGTLHQVVHSVDAKQSLWESNGVAMKKVLGLPVPEHTFSIPFVPLYCPSRQQASFNQPACKITLSTLLDRWKEEGQYLLYSRPLS